MLLQYGSVDTTVTANTVNYVVFNKNGVRTFVAFNPEPYASSVTFNVPGSGARTLDLPARSEVVQTVAANGTVQNQIVNGMPDLSIDMSSNQLFLASSPPGSTSPSPSPSPTLLQGQTGLGEQTLTIPAGTSTPAKPIDTPRPTRRRSSASPRPA